MQDIKKNIRALADKYSKTLNQKIELRMEEMNNDDKSHYLIY